MGTRSDAVVSAAPVRTKRRDTGDIICSGKCGSGAAGRCGVSGRLLLAKVRGGCRSRDLSAPLTRSAGGRIDWRLHVLVGFSIVNNRLETMERLLLQPMVLLSCQSFYAVHSDWVRFAKRTVGFTHPHVLPFMIVSVRVSESLACLQIVVNRKCIMW